MLKKNTAKTGICGDLAGSGRETADFADLTENKSLQLTNTYHLLLITHGGSSMPRLFHFSLSLLLLALCFLCTGLLAAEPVDPPSSLSGLTGLIRVPTAEVLPDGALRLGYNAFDDVESTGLGGTVVYNVGLGFLPGVEGVLGMGNATLGQDLTVHGKWQVHARDGRWPAIALGVVDLKRTGGDPYDEPTAFAVATQRYDRDLLALTLGAAGGSGHSGVLAGASYRVLPGVEVQAEYDTARVNAGVAVRAVKGLWLRAADTDIGSVFSASYQFSLAPEEHPAPVATTEEIGPSALSPADTVAVAQQALVELGMEYVRVTLAHTTSGDLLHAYYENRRYTLDQADGMRAVLIALARLAPASVDTLELTLLERDVPVVTLQTPADAYRRYMAGKEDIDAFRAQLRVELLPARSAPATVLATTPTANSAAGHTDLLIGPGVLNTLGTDFGSFDYGLTIRPEVAVPIRKGLLADSRWTYPVAGELVKDEPRALKQDRLLVGYLLRPTEKVIAQGVAGRFTPEYDGAAVEAAMPVGEKGLLHGVAASLKDTGDDAHRTYLLGEYWRVFPELRAQARLFGGKFVEGDSGWGVDMLRFFGNLQIGIGFRDTDRSNILEAHADIPLSPSRQPQRPATLRLRTPDYLNYRLRSVLTSQNQSSNDLDLAATTANELPLGFDLVNTVLDYNRLLPEYLVRRFR